MRYSAFLLVLLIGAFGFTEDQIPNLQQPQYHVYTAGQPSEEGFQLIADMGVKTVINVLPEKECRANEEMMVKGQKMDYYAVPFQTSDFKMETVQRFAELMRSQERPVLVHCSTGNHVGGLWFAYRILMEKAPVALALKEARRIGLKPELEDAVFDWVMDQRDKIQAGALIIGS